jgi:hypothetical protein
MYGYIGLNFKATEEEALKYSYYYCGLCHSLKKNFGNIYRISIIKEIVLFSMMKNDFSENNKFRCAVNGFKPRYKYNLNFDTDKYSYLNMLVIYGKLFDYKTEKKPIPSFLISKLKKRLLKFFDKSLLNDFEKLLIEQSEIEKEKLDIDEYAKPSQKIMQIIYNLFFDEIPETLPITTGTLVYLTDSVYDFEKDNKRNNFNALKKSFSLKSLKDSDEEIKKRILFTYDICSNDISNKLIELSDFNYELVKKILDYSLTFHRNKIHQILYPSCSKC